MVRLLRMKRCEDSTHLAPRDAREEVERYGHFATIMSDCIGEEITIQRNISSSISAERDGYFIATWIY